VYFSIFIVVSLSLPLRPVRDQQKWKSVLRPIALQFQGAHDLVAKPPTLWRIMREARIQHLHWVSAGRIDIPQPAGGLFADAPAGLRQMWEAGFGNGRGDFTNSCAVASRRGIF
jgi:hypothetical protein